MSFQISEANLSQGITIANFINSYSFSSSKVKEQISFNVIKNQLINEFDEMSETKYEALRELFKGKF